MPDANDAAPRKAKTWLRLPVAWQTDPLLDALTPEEFRVWFRLYCFAGKQDPEGRIPALKPRLLALEVARGDVALLTQTLEALVELEMLVEVRDPATGTPNGWQFQTWEQHQYAYRRYPSDAPDQVRDRMRAYRARKRGQQGGGDDGVTSVTSDVTSVTTEPAPVTTGYDTEERRSDENQNQNQRETRDETPRARAGRIPANFAPTEADLAAWLTHNPPADKRSMEWLRQQATIFLGKMQRTDGKGDPYQSHDWHQSFQAFLMRAIDGTLQPSNGARGNGARWGTPPSPYNNEALRGRKPQPN